MEDNVDVGRFCTQILEDLGYGTAWTANAEEAPARLGEPDDGFDAVFSDVVMPGMGGLALAEELRRRMPEMPVVLASGYSHVLAQDDAHGFELLQAVFGGTAFKGPEASHLSKSRRVQVGPTMKPCCRAHLKHMCRLPFPERDL